MEKLARQGVESLYTTDTAKQILGTSNNMLHHMPSYYSLAVDRFILHLLQTIATVEKVRGNDQGSVTQPHRDIVVRNNVCMSLQYHADMRTDAFAECR
jgi:hypothetical protein